MYADSEVGGQWKLDRPPYQGGYRLVIGIGGEYVSCKDRKRELVLGMKCRQLFDCRLKLAI